MEEKKNGNGVWADGRRRESLPIDSRLPEILSLLDNHQVIVVEAETGAGKTTRIPQAVLLAHPEIKIWMTQTRRNVVRWNGKRIAQEMGCQPGGIVGWRLFGDDPIVSRETRLTLVIDQSLTNRIRNEGGRLPEGLLIIDEAHERSVSTDLLLGLIKEALPNSPNTKVLVTSATIDTRKFSEFFGGAPVVSVSGRCFPVSTEVTRLGKYEHHSQAAARAACDVLEKFFKNELRTPTADGQGTPVSSGTVLILLPGKDDIASVVRAIRSKADELQAGSVSFESGTPEDLALDKIRSMVGSEFEITGRGIGKVAPKLDRVQVFSCHGESSPEEQDAVQDYLPEGTIRFVCGTEVLRSSVTIRDTVGVIDSLQVKRLLTDAKGVAHLDKIAISKAEADQGKGRAGRTAPGFYIACSFESEYERLQSYPTPAILREPITHVALQVAAVGRNMRDFAFIDVPPREKMEIAIERLKRLGALDENERITEVGEMLVQFPIDPERAKVLVAADKFGILPEAVVVTAVLESEGIFFGPNKEESEFFMADEPMSRLILSYFHDTKSEYSWKRWEELKSPVDPASVDLSNLPEWINKDGEMWKIAMGYKKFPHDNHWIADAVRRFWAGDSRSDFVGMVRCYRAFKAEERRLKIEEPVEGWLAEKNGQRQSREHLLRDWCKRWFVNFKRIRMAENVMRQIREELASSPLRMANGLGYDREFDCEALTKALASGLIDNVSRKSEGSRGSSFSGPLGSYFQLAYQSACSQGSSLILVGGLRKIPARRGFIHLATEAAPLKPEWLVEVMPQLCTKKRLSDHRYDSQKDLVVETEEVFFVDLKAGNSPVGSLDKEAAAKTFCDWLADTIVNERRY